MIFRYRGLWSKYKVFIPLLWLHYIGKRNLSNKPPIKFLIISRSRTGSTMLINYLKRVPNSYVQSELMGRKAFIPFWKRIPDLVFNKRGDHLLGFKYFYYHPVDDWDSNSFIFQYIFSHPEIKVIHWMREDLFAVVMSRYIAVATGRWAKAKKESKCLKEFTIDEHSFKWDLERTHGFITGVRRMFSSYENYLELTYEDVTEKDGLEKMFKFLGLSNFTVNHTFHTSQKSKDKYGFVRNIDALKKIYDETMNSLDYK